MKRFGVSVSVYDNTTDRYQYANVYTDNVQLVQYLLDAIEEYNAGGEE